MILSKLPSHWKWVRLGEVCAVTKLAGFEYTKFVKYDEHGEFIALRAQNVRNHGIELRDIKLISKETASFLNRSKLNFGDVVMTFIGANIGEATWIDTNDRYYCAPNISKISPNPDLLFYKYLTFAIHSNVIKSQIREINGSTAQPSLSMQNIRDFFIPIPPVPEQQRIADIIAEQMSDIDAARIAIEAELEAAKALTASYLREVFESDDAQEWECVPLLEICQGLGQYGLSLKSSYDSTGLPILGMSNIREGKLIWDSLKYLTHEDAELNKYGLSEGDILFNRTNSAELVGKTAIFDGSRDAVFASYLIRFRAKPNKADPHFISAYINSIGRKFIERNMARAIGQVNISASTMHKMPIPLPPLEVQKAIVNKWANQIEQINTMTNIVQIRLNAINALPDAVLRRAFNGDL